MSTFLSTDKESLIRRLTGAEDHSPFPPSVTEAGGGGKFSPTGEVLPHAGNTFICHLSPNEALHQAMKAMQAAYRASPWAHHFSFLPPSSFHMTIFCGISGNPLGADGWPQGYPAETTLAELTTAYREKLATFSAPQAFYVHPIGFHNPLTLRLSEDNAEEGQKLRDTRNRLRQLTGFYRPDHDRYQFHTTMGYLVRWFSEAEAEEFITFMQQVYAEHIAPVGRTALGAVEFCQFDDMQHFEPVGFLGADGFVPA